jgi:hypothetical protein
MEKMLVNKRASVKPRVAALAQPILTRQSEMLCLVNGP